MDLARADLVIRDAIADGAAPGACYVVGHGGSLEIKAFGRLTYAPDSPEVRSDTVWDLASLTKVIGTTTAAMILFDEGLLHLDQPVCELVPAFGKPGVTVRNLLLHDSGLAPSHPDPTAFVDPAKLLESILSQELVYETGADTAYSDLGFIALGVALEALSEQRLDRFLQDRVWDRLGMKDTAFNPGPELQARCAPTERPDGRRLALRLVRGIRSSREWITGEVHDPTAMFLGGVAGHAGLFSTAEDLALFMTGLSGLVKPATLELFTTRGSDKSSRALGWDTPSDGSSAGSRLGPRSFGHTGFTGTSVWSDPDLDLFAILLTNRVHPTATNQKIRELRVRFIDEVAV